MQSLFINNKENEIPEYCSICGEALKPDEIDICDNCKASILIDDDIPPNM